MGWYREMSSKATLGSEEARVARGRRSNLLMRVLSSAILLPILFLVLYKGGWWFFAFVFVALSLATWEYVYMLGRFGYPSSYVFATGVLWSILVDFQLGSRFPGLNLVRPALAILLFASLCWHVLRDKSFSRLENWLLPIGGALYIGWMGGHLLLLRALPRGAYLLFAVLAMTMLADTGAFFVGRAWGKHRLAPQISPKKTWEGLIGGTVVAVIGGSVLLVLGGMNWVHGVALGLLLSTLPVFGDLGVSMIKRQVGVKDSGNLIPGHGGAFDRVDSLLITGAIGYYYLIWAMGVLPML
jgi:phosphatidate cytidylyltransferase